MSISFSWPYEPNISRRCASVTFFVSFSTTILALRRGDAGEPLRERGLRDAMRCDVARGGVRERLRYGERERETERGVMERRGVREGDLDGIARRINWAKVVCIYGEVGMFLL